MASNSSSSPSSGVDVQQLNQITFNSCQPCLCETHRAQLSPLETTIYSITQWLQSHGLS